MLADDLRTANLGHLADAIPRIEDFVERWWSKEYMPWFTDHGPGHSRRVAEYADQISTIPALPENVRLTPLERFILWSAAWLHDIGMQVLLETYLGETDSAGHAKVRAQHPSQSATEIRANRDAIGFPSGDKPLVNVVSFVAQAHGTDFYRDSVELLRDYSYVGNKKIRGPLLASILLLADELDLHYERALPLPGRVNLNYVSEAHALKHRCVLSSGVAYESDAPLLARIAIKVARAPGMSLETLAHVERWIVEKLRRQIAMIETEFVAGFGGFVELSRAIRVDRIYDPIEVEEPKPEVMATIRADNAESDLIDHRLARREALEAVDARGTLLMVGRLREIWIDEDGREDLLRAVAARLRLGGSCVLESWALVESGGAASLDDIVTEWARHATVASPLFVNVSNDEHESGIESRLAARIGSFEGHVVLTISSIDMLEDAELYRLLSDVLPRFRKAGDVSIIATASPDFDSVDLPGPVSRVSLLELDSTHVAEDMARYLNRQSAISVAGVADFHYSTFKSLRASYDLKLV